jgi:hypothetical protein
MQREMPSIYLAAALKPTEIMNTHPEIVMLQRVIVIQSCAYEKCSSSNMTCVSWTREYYQTDSEANASSGSLSRPAMSTSIW